jgi:hypothetical protein
MFFVIVLPPPYSAGSEDHSLGVKQPGHEAGHFFNVMLSIRTVYLLPHFMPAQEQRKLS